MITRSITLHATQVKDMARYFSTLEDKPFLYAGNTCILPIDIKLENSIENGPASTFESFLKRQGEITGTARFVGLNLSESVQDKITIDVNIIKCYIIKCFIIKCYLYQVLHYQGQSC